MQAYRFHLIDLGIGMQGISSRYGAITMGALSQLTNTAWRTLYVAALFEADSAVLPEKIAQAEAALVRRARELLEM
jgi:hypothetical protein